MHRSLMVIILFNMVKYKSAFSAYSFRKSRYLSFCVLVFQVSISLVFSCFLFCVLNLMSPQKTEIKLFNFVLTLFKRSVKI